MQSDVTTEVQGLLDKQAIHELVMTYSRGVDRLDADIVKSTYAPEASDDHGYFRGTGLEFADYVVEAVGDRWESTSHTVCNELVELAGDEAWGEIYFMSYHIRTEGGQQFRDTMAGRYVDRYERRDDGWKIAHRTIVHDWSCSEPLEDWPRPTDVFVQGRRDRSDAAYSRDRS
jgi:ketosteroid isomerase-like protein